MPRPLLAVLALALGACGGPSRPPAEAYADFLDAVDRRDAPAAYAYLDEAADGGHLDALARQIAAHERGYVTGRPGDAGTNLPVETPLFRLGGLQRRYARAVRDSAAAGTPGGLVHAAHALTGDLNMADGALESGLMPADRDSAEALLARMTASSAPRLPAALLALHLGDEPAALRLLDDAVAAAEPQACALRLLVTDGYDRGPDAAGYAAYVDRVEGCPVAPGGEGLAAREFRALAEQRAAGNAEASALLDSLGALGVFDRHPHLAPKKAGPHPEG